MTVELERIPGCPLNYCPAPTDPDWHRCLICQSLKVEHDHTKGRGKTLTNDPRWVVPMCPAEHKKISLKIWTRGYIPADKSVDGLLHYYILDERGKTIFDEALPWMQAKGDDDGLAVDSSGSGVGNARRRGGNSSDTRAVVEAPDKDGADPPGGTTIPPTSGPSTALSLPVASLESESWAGARIDDIPTGVSPASDFQRWQAIGVKLKEMVRKLPWLVGDWLVEADRYGEEAWQFIDELGLKEGSLGQYIKTSTAFPPEARRDDLVWSIHRRLAYTIETPEERAEWLEKTAENKWTRDELAEALAPVTAVVKRCAGRCPDCSATCGRRA